MISKRSLTASPFGEKTLGINTPPHSINRTWVTWSVETTMIRNESLFTKCGWTPFDGVEVAGRVERVTLYGQVVYENGRLLAQPGSGDVIPILGDLEIEKLRD